MLLTSWRDIETSLFPVLRALSPIRPYVEPILPCLPALTAEWQRKLAAPVHASAGANPDAVLNTLRYMFFHMRCGILVCVRGGSVVLFAPFANAAFVNTFSCRIATDVPEYATRKACETRRPPEALLPMHKWWLNGGMVCSVMPANVWGDAHCAELVAMLGAAAPALPDVDIFINKRDYPHLRRDGGEPYSRFTGQDELVRERYRAYAPILSFYGGTDFADLLMPLTEDWKLTAAPLPPVDHGAFMRAAAVAVWRGSATGYGITPESNPRLQLWAYARAHPDCALDVAFTAVNARDKLIDGGTQLGYLYGVELGAFVSAAEQAARFRYVLYVDGHCAANRYGALMASCRVILKIASVQDADCGNQWLFPDLRGVCIDADGVPDAAEVAEADHCSIHADLRNLKPTLAWLAAQPDSAWRIACHARARAPTRDTITRTWSALLACVNASQAVTDDDSSSLAAWFSPYDPAYASSGTAHGDCFAMRVR